MSNMTLEDAAKVAMIVGHCDHGRRTCVTDLVQRLNKSFPEFSWTVGNDLDWSVEVLVAKKPEGGQ